MKEMIADPPPFSKGGRGDLFRVLKYKANLKHNARRLRMDRNTWKKIHESKTNPP